MSSSLTIRLTAAQRKALRARAAATGRTESELVRAAIDRDLRGRGTMGERVGHLFGRLDFDPTTMDADLRRARLRRNNRRS